MADDLFEALFDESEARPLSVSELTGDIKGLLERSFSSVWVEGEITGFHSAGSGHWYFSLSDGDAILKAACFRGQNLRIRFKPASGMLVRCRGRISLYEPRGEYQLVVESLEPVGEGALTAAFEQIKAKLNAEGLFDPALKRPLPEFPRRVGVVTSPTGAALQDILTVLERRARSVSVVIIPTLVQGDQAGEQVAKGIALANEFSLGAESRHKIDVLIVGRGGGSAEDLWAFNEEQVARAIRASNIPVISAVGHEIDFTIADLVADLRAPTPSAAAEIVAKAESEVIEHLLRTSERLERTMNYRMLAARTDVQSLAMAPVFSGFPARLRELGHRIGELNTRAAAASARKLRRGEIRLGELTERLSPVSLAGKVAENRRRLALLDQRTKTAAGELTKARHGKLEHAMAKLDAMSPLNVLKRGFSLTQDSGGRILRDAAETAVGERLSIRLAKGSIAAEVREIHREE